MPQASSRTLTSSTSLRALAQQINQTSPATARAVTQIQEWIDTMEARLRALQNASSTSSRSPFGLDIDGAVILDGTLRVEALIASVAWITTAMIQDLAVTTAKIADLAVTNAKIGNAEITSAKIASLTADLITAGTLNAAIVNLINVNAASINAGFLSADRIQGGTLDITKLTLRAFISGVIFVNNNPGTTVTWTSAYAVYLDGTAYAIASGNTTNRYIWFEPTVSTTVLQTSNTFTAAPGRYRIAINNSGVATEVWRQDGANEIVASMLSPASVTGGASGAIAANTITGDNIQAKTILTEKLVVGNFENLCEDPNFEQNSTASWVNLFADWAYSNDGQARNGTWALKKTTVAADDESLNGLFAPCRPGDIFYAEAYFKGTGNGTAKVRINFYTADKTTRTTFDSGTVSATGSYALASVSATCPASRVWVRISVVANSHTSGVWYADDCLLKAKQIAAWIESLNAGSITAGTLDVARLAAASIDATKLNIKDIIVVGLTLTNNSPGAGSVAWSACTVYYNGTSYSVGSGNSSSPLIVWDVNSSPTTFSGATSYTPQIGKFTVATNTGGTGDESWNKPGRGAIQESNIQDGLIRGIQPEIAHQRQNINTTTTYTLVNYSSGSGGLFSIGFVVVDSAANPPYTQMQVLLGITIDGATEQLYAIYDGAYPYSGVNSWDSRLVAIAADKKTPGYNVGDYITMTIGMGFSSSCVVKVYINTTGGSGTIRWDMTVLWGKKTT